MANGVVYVGSLNQNVYALNASTGAKLWSYGTGGQGVFLACSGQWTGLCRLARRQSLRMRPQEKGTIRSRPGSSEVGGRKQAIFTQIPLGGR